LPFAVDMKYDLPRSRAALRAEEVKKKKIAKAQRRAISRVDSRGGIIEPTPGVGDGVDQVSSAAQRGENREDLPTLAALYKY